MEERVYITEAFKQELYNLAGDVEYITIYRTENDKVFFTANRCKLHLTRAELAEARLTEPV